MAELAMRRLLAEEGLDDRVEVASAGTGDYHVGEPADERAAATLRDAGYDPNPHRARQFLAEDFAGADVVVALDRSNAENLRRIAPNATAAAKVHLLRSFDRQGNDSEPDVPDPYFGGEDGFPHVLDLVEAACRGLVEYVRTELAPSR